MKRLLLVMTERQGNKCVKRRVLWTSSKNWQRRCQNDVLCVKVWDHVYQVHCEILMLVTGFLTCDCVAVFPQLYFHMLDQRRKIIGGEDQRVKHD